MLKVNRYREAYIISVENTKKEFRKQMKKCSFLHVLQRYSPAFVVKGRNNENFKLFLKKVLKTVDKERCEVVR